MPPGVIYEKLGNGKLKGNVILGYWTDLNNKVIKYAYFGDTVRFHILTMFVSNGEKLTLQFYDKDWMNDTKVGSQKTASVDGTLAHYNFKISKDWEGMIEGYNEGGEEIELFCEATYKGKSVDLAYEDNQTLKVYRKHKVLLVFYHGGPNGRGQIKEKSNDDTGGTGRIYDNVFNYAKSRGFETVGAIIAPAATQGFGVSTGARFLRNNYKPGYEVLIYGYSYGGDNAVNLAEYADSLGYKVDTLVIVDSSDGPAHGTTVDTSVPDNVNYTLNIYQRRAAGGFSKSGKDSDDPNKSENSSSDGSSNTMASRGYPHTAEGKNKVDNIDVTNAIDAKGKPVTHGSIQDVKFDLIVSTFKKRINGYKYPK